MVTINSRGVPVLIGEDYVWVFVVPEGEEERIACVWQELTDDSEKCVKLGDKITYKRKSDEKGMVGTVVAIGPNDGYFHDDYVYYADRLRNFVWKNVEK